MWNIGVVDAGTIGEPVRLLASGVFSLGHSVKYSGPIQLPRLGIPWYAYPSFVKPFLPPSPPHDSLVLQHMSARYDVLLCYFVMSHPPTIQGNVQVPRAEDGRAARVSPK